MKTRLLIDKLPDVLDYALAIVLNTIPGIAEADGDTKQLYTSLTRALLSDEWRSKREFARRNLRTIKNSALLRPSKASGKRACQREFGGTSQG